MTIFFVRHHRNLAMTESAYVLRQIILATAAAATGR
jgi:hypothetical protein